MSFAMTKAYLCATQEARSIAHCSSSAVLMKPQEVLHELTFPFQQAHGDVLSWHRRSLSKDTLITNNVVQSMTFVRRELI